MRPGIIATLSIQSTGLDLPCVDADGRRGSSPQLAEPEPRHPAPGRGVPGIPQLETSRRAHHHHPAAVAGRRRFPSPRHITRHPRQNLCRGDEPHAPSMNVQRSGNNRYAW